MHFSISDTEEAGSFTLYKIYVNGAHHCSLRYSQLHNLNEQLLNEFSAELPAFPKKSLLPLSAKEKEERKVQLEKYLQKISQLPKVLNSDLFITFFLNAQKETQIEVEKNAEITIYLMNFEKIILEIESFDVTEDVLIKLMKKINLNTDYLYYFGLYLVKKAADNDIQIVRKLQDFESPWVSLKAANEKEKHRIILRKSILDSDLETALYEDKIATNLLYIQAVSDLEKKWTLPNSQNIQKQLSSLQAENAKKQFLQLIRTQKFYGFLHFVQSTSDYPKPNSNVLIAIGKRAMYFRVLSENSAEPTELAFRITRIKCWKILGRSERSEKDLELSFEYLFAKDSLKFVTIKSEQAILISMTLQTIVDEIIMMKEGKAVKKFTERPKNRNLIPFLTRQKSLISMSSQQPVPEDTHRVSKNVDQNTLFENEEFISNDDL